jgi:lipopolysaccharide export system permease protein
VFWSILHRSIFLELTKVFLLSLLGITGIILMAGLVAEASQHGLGPAQILQTIPLIIPSTLPYTIPATTLFATSVVYGRLAHDNEILAIKAAGINLLRVISPALLLGLAMSVITAVLYYSLIPYTHHLLRRLDPKDVEDVLYTVLKRENFLKRPGMNYEIYVRRVQGRQLQDAIFKRRKPHGAGFDYDIIAHAEEAELHALPEQKKLVVHMYRCNIVSSEKNGNSGWVKDQPYEVDLPTDFNAGGTKFRASDMTWEELWDFRAEVVKAREKLLEDIDKHRRLLAANPNLPGIVDRNAVAHHIENRLFEVKQKQQEIRNVDVEFQMRPALSLGCLFFVLVGCPVGIWFSRSDYLSAFITCFLPIVFLYYPLLVCGINQGKSGTMPQLPAVWAANGLMGVVALVLFRRLLKN